MMSMGLLSVTLYLAATAVNFWYYVHSLEKIDQ